MSTRTVCNTVFCRFCHGPLGSRFCHAVLIVADRGSASSGTSIDCGCGSIHLARSMSKGDHASGSCPVPLGGWDGVSWLSGPWGVLGDGSVTALRRDVLIRSASSLSESWSTFCATARAGSEASSDARTDLAMMIAARAASTGSSASAIKPLKLITTPLPTSIIPHFAPLDEAEHRDRRLVGRSPAVGPGMRIATLTGSCRLGLPL